MPLFVATAKRLVDHFTNVAAYTPPTTAYAILLRAVPNGDETGSQIAALESTATDYAPVLVDWDDTLWGAADDDGVATQLLDVVFGDTVDGYEEPFAAIGFKTTNTGTDTDEGLCYRVLGSALTPPADSTPTIAASVTPIRLGFTTTDS